MYLTLCHILASATHFCISMSPDSMLSRVLTLTFQIGQSPEVNNYLKLEVKVNTIICFTSQLLSLNFFCNPLPKLIKPHAFEEIFYDFLTIVTKATCLPLELALLSWGSVSETERERGTFLIDLPTRAALAHVTVGLRVCYRALENGSPYRQQSKIFSCYPCSSDDQYQQ